jgi:acyl-CoA reductase-like NAD-dependent aldehyde dehydrogenase
MRNAIVQLPDQRTTGERRQVLRAAIRQLERADMYLAAVMFMDIGDRPAERALSQLRADLDALRRHLGEQRVNISN